MYEYKVLKSAGGSLINEAQLNDLGDEGWRLVQIIAQGEGSLMYFIRDKVSREVVN